jgi:probable selenium-dependent hydroxylase accessory protein YqeC
MERLNASLGTYGHVFLGGGLLASGKVRGVSRVTVEEATACCQAEIVLCEADGSAGRPLKVPAPHEPMVPDASGTVVAVMGLEVLGKRLDSRLVYRTDVFRRITGIERDGVLTSECLKRAFTSPDGLFKGVSPRVRRIAFFNKSDLLTDRKGAEALAKTLLSCSSASPAWVVIGSALRQEYEILRNEG